MCMYVVNVCDMVCYDVVYVDVDVDVIIWS